MTDTVDNYICALSRAYSFDSPVQQLQESIDYLNSFGDYVVGAYQIRDCLPLDSIIIMHVKSFKENPPMQKDANTLLLEHLVEMPWFAKEFLTR